MGQTFTSLDYFLPREDKNSRRGVHTPKLGARYESARYLPSQRGLWANADGMSANALNDHGTRARMRSRSRYEDQNAGYMSGLIGDRANETIGTGPRLQLTFPETSTDPDFLRTVAVPEGAARKVELKWAEHCERIHLLDKLLMMDETETRDGEVFALLFANPLLPADAPQLDCRPIEADQCHTPDLAFTQNAVDGIVHDKFGNPIEYHFLRNHPGDTGILNLSPLEYDKYKPDRVIHFFKPRRPGQARGVPGLQSSLPLYGKTRAYTDATLATANRQATLGGTIEDQNKMQDGFGDDDPAEGESDFEPGSMVPIGGTEFWHLPSGVTAKPFDPTQPATTYGEFKGEIITEAGRPIGASRLISTGSAAGLNYASGRLEQQWWQRAIRIRRERFVLLVLNRIFKAWLREAALIPGFLPVVPPVSEWQINWRWPGFVSIDPVKDNTANQIALESGQTSLTRVCAERGDDFEEIMLEKAAERKLALKLGLPDPYPPVAPPAVQPAPADQEDEDA